MYLGDQAVPVALCLFLDPPLNKNTSNINIFLYRVR